MFQENPSSFSFVPRWAVGALALLSLTSLLVTAWILADFSQELEVLKQLSSHLPSSDLPEATELAGELRFQSRLSLVLILNTLASSVALVLLVRAYLTSEKSLRKTRVLATDILASIDQGIITTDQDGKILSINPYGELLLEQSMTDPNLNSPRFPEAHQPMAELCRQVLDTHRGVRDKDYEVNHDGHLRTLRVGCSLLRDHRKRLIGSVIHVRDVSEKVLMEQRLRRMERYMSLGSLAAGLQHEIKNPLSALALHVQLLGEAIEEENPSAETRATLDVLQKEIRRITQVLESFRDFASVEHLNCTPVDLQELVGRTVRLVRPQADEQGVQIEWEDLSEKPTQIFADSVRMEQVLVNLVLNALAAMPDGGALRIEVKPEAPSEVPSGAPSVVLGVIDSGPGIPKDLADKVFDPYFTTRSTGTGMGLAICEKIVNQHNGVIDFETSSNGTHFTITLPPYRDPDEQRDNETLDRAN